MSVTSPLTMDLKASIEYVPPAEPAVLEIPPSELSSDVAEAKPVLDSDIVIEETEAAAPEPVTQAPDESMEVDEEVKKPLVEEGSDDEVSDDEVVPKKALGPKTSGKRPRPEELDDEAVEDEPASPLTKHFFRTQEREDSACTPPPAKRARTLNEPELTPEEQVLAEAPTQMDEDQESDAVGEDDVVPKPALVSGTVSTSPRLSPEVIEAIETDVDQLGTYYLKLEGLIIAAVDECSSLEDEPELLPLRDILRGVGDLLKAGTPNAERVNERPTSRQFHYFVRMWKKAEEKLRAVNTVIDMCRKQFPDALKDVLGDIQDAASTGIAHCGRILAKAAPGNSDCGYDNAARARVADWFGRKIVLPLELYLNNDLGVQ